MSKLSNKQLALALYESTIELDGKDLDQVTKNFVKLLYKKHKLKQAGNIIKEFVKYAKKKEGIMDIEITTARKMDPKTVETIKKIFGENTESVEKTNKDIIGGVIIKTESVIFDGSIKTQLNKLKNKISN